MSIFDIFTLLGGLAMFLYGMKLMGNGLKESSSGALKQIMERVTNNVFKAFLLGLGVTALIQSSTATIVITSGLVAAGIITLRQSLGIIVGANVGTTVTGQIIRLLDIRQDSTFILQLFRPSTLAPLALIVGVTVMMFGSKVKNHATISSIAIGFGILFSGLLSMTSAVDNLGQTGIFDNLFSMLGRNPVLGYVIGATVAFILQSSSATIGILQAFSASGLLLFNSIYAVIVGVYLGDCVTTFIVCSIGSKADAKRVGLVHIIFNLAKSALVLAGVAILRMTGVLDGIWNVTATPGIIADTNTIFNLICSVVFLPLMTVFEKMSYRMIKDDAEAENKYADKIAGLSSQFLATPAIALNRIYDVLLTMLSIARSNIEISLDMINDYDENSAAEMNREEDSIDMMADYLSRYLVELSPHLNNPEHVRILNQYYRMLTEFEHLGDHAIYITEVSRSLRNKDMSFSDMAYKELQIIRSLLNDILDKTELAFKNRDIDSATAIEPMIEVAEELLAILKEKHMDRLMRGVCHGIISSDFMNLISYLQEIANTCSNIGLAIILRVHPELAAVKHDYLVKLHTGEDTEFNKIYTKTFNNYFERIQSLNDENTADIISGETPSANPNTEIPIFGRYI